MTLGGLPSLELGVLNMKDENSLNFEFPDETAEGKISHTQLVQYPAFQGKPEQIQSTENTGSSRAQIQRYVCPRRSNIPKSSTSLTAWQMTPFPSLSTWL